MKLIIWTLPAALLLAACTISGPPVDPYQEYLSGVPVADPNGCVAQAAIAAGRLGPPPVLRGVWWDCGQVAKSSEIGRIGRMVAGGAFATEEFAFANSTAAYVATLPVDGLTAKDRADLRQLQTLAQVLSRAPPMTMAGATTLQLSATYDKAGLLRIPVKAGNDDISAVLDTGAAVSLMAESQARKLGLAIHKGSAVASSTRTSVDTDWAVLPELRIGRASFRQVLFLVVPDTAMGLPDGYTIDAIIGAPVLRRLETVCVANDAVTFAPASPNGRPTQNFVDARFVDSAPILSIIANGRRLTAYLDSGANASKLSARFFASNRTSFDASRSRSAVTGGVGGTKQVALTAVKPARLSFGNREVVLDQLDVDVSDEGDSEPAPSMTIGQDVLRKMGSWKLDYANARFEAFARCQ